MQGSELKLSPSRRVATCLSGCRKYLPKRYILSLFQFGDEGAPTCFKVEELPATDEKELCKPWPFIMTVN